MTVRARKARSWETITAPPGRSATKRSSRARPSKSRSLVGSSSSRTSKRREQDRGQRRARRLAAGERDGLEVEQRGVEAEVAQDGLRARLEVGAAERQPRLEGVGVAVRGAGASAARSARRGLHARVGVGDAGAPREVVLERLAGRAVGLLRQVAGGAGGQPDGARVGPVEPGEQAQQRRLARAVGPDDAEHVARRDGHRDAGEDRRRPRAPCADRARSASRPCLEPRRRSLDECLTEAARLSLDVAY